MLPCHGFDILACPARQHLNISKAFENACPWSCTYITTVHARHSARGRTVQVVNGGRTSCGAQLTAHSMLTAHSLCPQLTAHSSQLTAHSSVDSCNNVCTELSCVPAVSCSLRPSSCTRRHAEGLRSVRVALLAAFHVTAHFLPCSCFRRRSAALRLSADGAPGREACSCARSRSEACERAEPPPPSGRP